jgi:hypothetical protein
MDDVGAPAEARARLRAELRAAVAREEQAGAAALASAGGRDG